MRTLAGGAAVALLALTAHGCTAKQLGEIVLVVQTDLSLPKDIDSIRIEVSNDGVPKFQQDFQRLGDANGEIKLPGTLALVASDKADAAVDVRVSARSGGKSGTVRILREVVTTVPQDRSVLLPMPVQFLCDGLSGKGEGDAPPGNVCPDGQTCLAGTCADAKVDSSALATYADAAVFGDGSCFDTSKCYGAAKIAMVDAATCTFDVGGPNVNVALETEGEGICTQTGCYVTLDARDPLGWQLTPDGRIQLPAAVCDPTKKAKDIVAVVYAPATDACPQKNTKLPTCGPWSNAAKNPPSRRDPVALAGGQAHPGSIALASDRVLWSIAGASGKGAIKQVGLTGGSPTIIADMTPARAVTTLGSSVFWTTANDGTPKSGAVWSSVNGNNKAIQSGLDNPEGIAAVVSSNLDTLYFTDFTSGGVYEAPAGVGAAKIIASGNYPYRIVADGRYAYWTNEGSAEKVDGSVARYDAKTGLVTTLAAMQPTPRALAIDAQAGGATALYFATFAKSGAIVRVDLSGATPGKPEALVTGLAYPNGVAVDDKNVYFTARDAGKILALPRGAAAGTPPTVIADGQASPAAIAVDANAIYWVNEGSSTLSNGAIVKLDKAP